MSRDMGYTDDTEVDAYDWRQVRRMRNLEVENECTQQWSHRVAPAEPTKASSTLGFFFGHHGTESSISNEVHVYEPEDLNKLLLKQTKQITNNYRNIKLIGDITRFTHWKNAGCGIDVSMNGEKIKCKVWARKSIEPAFVQQHLNTRCIITGSVEAEYFNGHQFYLEVDSILHGAAAAVVAPALTTKIKDDTKLNKLKSMCENKGYFENKKQVDWKKIERIGIISKQNTQGYDDFCNQLTIPLDTTLETISLEGDKTNAECMEAIENLQDTDVIIIIRGGGDTGEISNSFDVIDLFETMKKSGVPIITAIGHEQDKGDKLLITNVSDIDFPTPTACAKGFNDNVHRLLSKAIDVRLNSNTDSIYKILEKQNTKLHKQLKIDLEQFIKNKFGGPITKVDNDDRCVIIEKNGEYYGINLTFDNKLEFNKADMSLKDKIMSALDDEDIATIKKSFNKLNTNDDKISTDIQDNIKSIEKNKLSEDKISEVKATKISQYFLKPVPYTNNFDNLMKIRKMLLWYQEQIQKSEYGDAIDKEIYHFIRNI